MNRTVAAELKHLEMLQKEQDKIVSLMVSDINERDEILHKERLQSQKISKQIRDLKNMNKEVIVSEHATLRYITRVMGIDVEKLRTKILPNGTTGIIDGKYPIGDGFVSVVKNNVVVTVE